MSAGRAETTADALLGLVLDGTLPPGSSLPSEAELAGRFAVSRLTVREAIRSLASTRVIRVQQGRSSIIEDHRAVVSTGSAPAHSERGHGLRRATAPPRAPASRRSASSRSPSPEMAAERRTRRSPAADGGGDRDDAGVARRRRRSAVRGGGPRVPRGALRGRGQRVPSRP